MSYKSSITVLVISAAKTFYTGQAYAVTAENEVGPFDVLQGHRDFITLVKKKITVHISPKQAKDITIDRGVLTVKDNSVRVYMGI